MQDGVSTRDAAARTWRKRLRVDHTRVAGPLCDFPLLVTVTDAALKARVHGGCVDRRDQLYFTGADGEALLDFDLEEYDPGTGAVRAWVRIPCLSPLEDAVLHLCCGDRKPGATGPGPVWDPYYRVLFPPAEAGVPDDFISPWDDLGIAQSMTVEAWVRCDEARAEALQVIAAQWSWRQEMGGFETYDAGDTDGLSTRGFFGAVFDGRYVYFSPQHDGQDRHGKVLRYDTHGEFASPRSWAAYDAGSTSGLVTRGYYGAVFDGRYVYFVPRLDGATHHSRVLRYDTHAAFASPQSWSAFDAGLPISFQSAAFDGRFIYFAPGYEGSKGPSGVVLRYDTQGPFTASASYATYDASRTEGLDSRCYDGAVFDGRYVYFAPLEAKGVVLRHDTQGQFGDPASWSARDCRRVAGLATGQCVGAVFDGTYVYFVPYAHNVVLRCDTRGDFHRAESWSAFAAEEVSGLDTRGYDGAVFDGRYVYFIPFWTGEDVARGFHAKVLRHDTRRDFLDRGAWQAVDAGATEPPNPGGFNGGAFDGRFIYFAPWRQGTAADGRIASHGRVLRYDTTGPQARFVLKYMDCGHNGGLCASVPGPSFAVNTTRGLLCAQANRNPGPGWHVLAGVYDGRRICLYVDGVLAGDQEGGGVPLGSDAQITVGGFAAEQARFRGAIRQLRISNTARSAEWVQTVWENLRAPLEFVRPEEAHRPGGCTP